jgi:hypothetical protein
MDGDSNPALPICPASDARDILAALNCTEGLPRAAIAAASERRVEMAPLLVQEIEAYLAAEPGSPARQNPTSLFLAFHLLGDWRERSAYRPMARLLRCPRDEIEDILGDAITATTHRVLAAVFDGDPQPICDVVLDPEADEFVRSRMCETLAMLAMRGELDRAFAARFLRDAFANLLPQAECYVWQGWQSAIAMLGLADLKDTVKKAFDRGFIYRGWLDYRHFERDLQRAIDRPGEPVADNDGSYEIFGDTIEELSTWYAFSERYEEDRKRRKEPARIDGFDPYEPAKNPFRGIGRNDPCPCGSGKKFKRCCLN